MRDRYATEPRTLRNAIRRFFTPIGLLPFVLFCLSVPFLRFDDLLMVSPGYAGMAAISDDENVWAGLAIALIVAGGVAWSLRSLRMQIVALVLQSAYFLGIAYTIVRVVPHSFGWAVYGALGLWGIAHAFWLVRTEVLSRDGGRS